jgi:N6-adenosine-specific RNA methylase IME4
MNERANTVHGRLLEAVHVSGYTFERACGELEWLLDEDRWKTVGDGFTDINKFLDTIDFSEFRVALDQRKKIAKRLQEIDASQRATGRLLGLSHTTVQRTLGTNVPAPPREPPPNEGVEAADGPNVPPDNSAVAPAGWPSADADPTREAKRIARSENKPIERAEKLAAAEWPEGKYGVILADPPWRPDAGVLDPTRQIENQYPTMTIDELIAERPKVDAIAADDCVLLMWTTAQKLAEATALVDGWGFVVKSGAVWIKPSVGMGYWFRQRHELIVLATRGNPMTPLEADRPDSVITADRRGHSEKPDALYDLIERMFPLIPKVELFARAERAGWKRVTNETTLRSA